MENDFRGLEDLIKNVVQESDCPFSVKIVVQESDCPFSQIYRDDYSIKYTVPGITRSFLSSFYSLTTNRKVTPRFSNHRTPS
jgi:hypothetical protein